METKTWIVNSNSFDKEDCTISGHNILDALRDSVGAIGHALLPKTDGPWKINSIDATWQHDIPGVELIVHATSLIKKNRDEKFVGWVKGVTYSELPHTVSVYSG